MKKSIICLVILALVSFGLGNILDSLNFYFVGHADVGSYLNVDELDRDRPTMLHFYSTKIIVKSHQEKKISFVRFDIKAPLNMYINQSIVIQNHMKNYEKYANQDYIRYTIGPSDYINGEAVTYIDIVPSEKNKYTTFFVGDPIQIDRLIIYKHIVSTVVILLLCVVLIMGLRVKYNNPLFIAFFASFLILLMDFKAGLIVLSTFMCFINGSILEKKYNIPIFLLMIFLGIFILDSTVYIALLLLVLLYQLYQSNSTKMVVALLSLGLLFSVHNYEYEFDFFKLFYKELQLIPFMVFIVLISYKRYTKQDEAIGIELLREMNHDFKIPLSVLKLNIEMLYCDQFETEAKRNRLINSSFDAIKTLENMLRCINAFLCNTRYVSKKYHTSILDCIDKAQDVFSRRNAKVEFLVYCDPQDTILFIESIWLERLIFNILDNAFKYTEDYGTITLTYKKEKNYILVIVDDTGIGMTKEELQKITTPFYRVDKSRSVSGLGLGLSIVKKIVDQLKGELRIDSTLGKGTSVTVKI